jgi:hypothetical protein
MIAIGGKSGLFSPEQPWSTGPAELRGACPVGIRPQGSYKDERSFLPVAHDIGRVSHRDESSLAQEADEPRRVFQALATEWKAGRAHSSKAKDLAMHPAYQRIIGMGQTAIPLLLEEMRRCPSQWTWALRAITGADPVPKESRGKLKEMAAAWIKWGIEKGYIE